MNPHIIQRFTDQFNIAFIKDPCVAYFLELIRVKAVAIEQMVQLIPADAENFYNLSSGARFFFVHEFTNSVWSYTVVKKVTLIEERDGGKTQNLR